MGVCLRSISKRGRPPDPPIRVGWWDGGMVVWWDGGMVGWWDICVVCGLDVVL